MTAEDKVFVFKLPYGQPDLVLKASQLTPEQQALHASNRLGVSFAPPRITREALEVVRDALNSSPPHIRNPRALGLKLMSDAAALASLIAAQVLIDRVIELLAEHDLFELPRAPEVKG